MQGSSLVSGLLKKVGATFHPQLSVSELLVVMFIWFTLLQKSLRRLGETQRRVVLYFSLQKIEFIRHLK